MYTKEEKQLKEYIDKLTYLYAKANTKSKKKRIWYDLETLSLLSTIYPNINDNFVWDKDIEFLKLFKEENIPFLDNIYNNKKLYKKIFKNVIEYFKEINFPLYKDYQKEGNIVLSNEEKNELIFSFLNDYNPQMLAKYKKWLEERIPFKNNPLQDSALICALDNLDEKIIYPIPSLKNTIYTTSLMVHELGHWYEMDLFKEIGISNYRSLTNPSPLYEVTSRLYEYSFLKYLIENNIYKEDTLICLRKYYIDLLLNAFDISLIYNMYNLIIDEEGYVVVEEPKIVEYANNLMNKLNYYAFYTEEGQLIDYREAYTYGLGDLLSIYLYNIYKEDTINFKKDYRSALLTCPYRKDLSSFENLGITKEVLLKGEVLKRELTKAR